jgi:hypothetical protein
MLVLIIGISEKCMNKDIQIKKSKDKKKVKRRESTLSKKPKPKTKKPGAVTVIGKSFSEEAIRKMISNLRNEERETSITAAIEFASENMGIQETMDKSEKFNSEKIYEEVLNVIEQNNQIVMDVLKETKAIRALSFIAKSDKVSEVTRNKAQDVLFPLQIEKPKESFTDKLDKTPKIKAFTPEMVKILWKKLNSTNTNTKVRAAIAFFANYSRIAPVMSKIPNLTITQLMVKAKDVTYQKTDPVFREIIKTWNKAALGYIAKSESMPARIRNKAAALLKKYFPTKVLKMDIETKKKEAAPKREKAESVVKTTYNVKKVKQIWANLRSRQKTIAIKAAIEVFSNFQDISLVMPKIPMLNITQVASQATDVASRNATAFFRKISLNKNLKALEFLIKSDATTPDLKAQALELFEQLSKEVKKKVFKPKVIFKTEEPEEEPDASDEPDDET